MDQKGVPSQRVPGREAAVASERQRRGVPGREAAVASERQRREVPGREAVVASERQCRGLHSPRRGSCRPRGSLAVAV